MKRILFIYLSLLISLFISAQTAATQFSDQRDDHQSMQKYSKSALNSSGDFLEGTIVIKVKEGIGPFEMQKTNISFGISSIDKKVHEFSVSKLEKRFKHKPIAKNSDLPDLSRIYRIEFPKSQNVHKVAKEFTADPNIEYAEAVPVYHAAEVPDDPMYASQQHLPQIMAPEAWDIHKGEDGDEVIVAIIDTGVDWLHPDLTENCWQNLGEDADSDGVTLEYNDGVWERDPDDLNGIDDDGNGFVDDVIGWDFLEFDETGDGSNPDPKWGAPDYQHGSHCAGIAAGRTNNGIGISSVSYNVKYMATQVDNGSFIYAWDGIIYAAENGADIISNSWGGGGYSQANQEVIDYAVGLGSIVVASAGNGNTSDSHYPSGYIGCISVAAVNPDDTRASFSHYGIGVDIAAPGVSILSSVTNNGYASWDGTSMAAPMVAGLLALIKSFQQAWTNDQLVEQVIGTVDNIDDINPGYEKALGSGRINAYHALVDEEVEVPQELRLEFLDFILEDDDGDGALEAGETGTISITMRNFAHLVSDDNAVFTLSSVDPAITVTTGSVSATIPADSVFEIDNAFQFEVATGAEPHIADFIIEVSSDLPVIYGSETEIAALVGPSGFFVWEGDPNSPDYSGTFIKDYLEARGYDVLYSNYYPHSFTGFDAVFLSFGNIDESQDKGTGLKYAYTIPIQEYLEQGGTLYTEGSPFLSIPAYLDYPNGDEFAGLFGVDSMIPTFSENPISKLMGLNGALSDGMIFNTSNQHYNWYIDKIIPAEGATVSFSEEGYGNVSIYNEGEYGQKTFHLGYSLAELVDEDPHSSRYNVLINVLDFFGYPEGEGYVVANFTADATEGKPDFEVQFTDWSIAENSETTGWAWDFDEDGIYDSYEKNPVWTYTEGGIFDVQLVVTNETNSDTLIKKDFITVRSGILVFEGKQNENGYSGTFINKYFTDHFYDEVGYTSKFPISLDGYDAIFLSFGNTGQRSTDITNSQESLISNYSLSGGKIYIEGGDAMNSIDPLSLWLFGLYSTNKGSKNDLEGMFGQEESIMDGLEFNSTNQLSLRSIDTYTIHEDFQGANEAFSESDYGYIAAEFDGSQVNGQKTFCMSYALADLEDGEGINTRNEMLSRILNFFDVVADVEEYEVGVGSRLKVFPNPAKDQITLQINALETGMANLEIFDLSGRIVSSKDQYLSKGSNSINHNISGFTPGIYYLRLKTENVSETIKWVKVD